MELNEMEKKLLFQVEGDYQTKILNELYMTVRYAELQKQIVNYAKTRAVYVEYRKAGYSKKFRTAHEAEILLHQAAKNRFDELGIKKLPLCQISPGRIHRSSGTKTESLFCL